MLEEQARGNIGLRYWDDPRKAQRLFAPTKWEIVYTSIEDSTAIVKVRVDSSLQGGIPIRKIWVYSLKNDGGWKISSLTENEL